MKKYIGFKMIEAQPMTHGEYSLEKYGEETNTKFSIENKNSEGYKVIYNDGYVSWSPKEVFEKAYMEITNPTTITQDVVDKFFVGSTHVKMGEKTLVSQYTLANGFTIITDASCVDPANYDEEIGKSICKERASNKVWELLAFLLHTAKNGIK